MDIFLFNHLLKLHNYFMSVCPYHVDVAVWSGQFLIPSVLSQIVIKKSYLVHVSSTACQELKIHILGHPQAPWVQEVRRS